jgi:hypothetical protein
LDIKKSAEQRGKNKGYQQSKRQQPSLEIEIEISHKKDAPRKNTEYGQFKSKRPYSKIYAKYKTAMTK